MSTNNTNIQDYDYPLPDTMIAQYPLPVRHESKLLVFKGRTISEDIFKNIDTHLAQGTSLVFNNTRVLQARLLFCKDSGAHIEIFCLEPHSPADYASNLSQSVSCSWKCLIGNAKKWKNGRLQKQVYYNTHHITLNAEITAQSGQTYTILFSWNNADVHFSDILEQAGTTPLPPYIKREADTNDAQAYQTVYSKHDGSVAAPTAGLHFTPQVFDSLQKKNISCNELTLHVGAGTFLPVKTDDYREHIMHREFFRIERSFLIALSKNPDHIFAVGTTSLRALESIYWAAIQINNNPHCTPDELQITQWMPYEIKTVITTPDALDILIRYMNDRKTDELWIPTSIIIVPGYTFRIVKGLITNFHQPKSTLLLLIAAFIGKDWRKIYDHALQNNFRFLSYGDSCLLIPQIISLQDINTF